MKILWFTWKDQKHPLAGGAEVVNEELAKRLVADGHQVIFLVGGFDGGSLGEKKDGYEIIRVGGRWTVYWQAYKYYKKNLEGWADIVIEEVNTIPFFTKFYVREKSILLIHQLCREIWFYQMFFPLNWIGYLIEPIYIKLLNNRPVITISNSTKQELQKFGFKNVQIMSVGIEIAPVDSLEQIIKYPNPTILSLGSIRPMKRTKDILRAYNLAKQSSPNLELIIAGDSKSSYGQEFLQEIEKSKYKQDIQYLGKVSKQKKIELMQKSHIILVTSVKEGWGLIVTEANSQGTPAIVYDVDGLRDSVRDQDTGYIAFNNTPQFLAKSIKSALNDKKQYNRVRHNAWQGSKNITFEQSYKDFFNSINSS